MSTNPLVYDTPVKALVDAFDTLLNGGHLKIYTGSQPSLNGSVTGTLLADLSLNATFAPASSASGGTVTGTANSITSATAGNSGTAGYFALVKSDGTTVVATGTVGTSGCDLNLATTSITSGNTVSVTAFTVTMPES